jgi:tetratricopeptide (TPR) repeat protein
MAIDDGYGNPLTTASPDAASHYAEGIRRTLARNSGGRDSLEAAVAAGPELAIAQATLGRALALGGDATAGRGRIAAATKLAERATRRERQHVAILAQLTDPDAPAAMPLMEEHLAEFPRDAYIVVSANFALNGSGLSDRKERMFALYEGVAGHYGEDPWFLGSYSFAHNELHHFAEARKLAERALEIERNSCNTSHSLAHVFYETGAHDDGAAFLDAWIDGSAWQAGYAGHLNWHFALFELTRGNYEAAVAIYDQRLRPGVHGGIPLGVTSDGASFLWRCNLFGIGQPPGAVEDTAAFVRERFPAAGMAFADVHSAMTQALAGDRSALDDLAAQLRTRLTQGRLPAGEVVPATVDGLGAYARGDFEEAVRILEPVRDDFVRVGGSRAQYEVLEDTLFAAYLKSGRIERAESALRARLDRRPSLRDERWLALVRAPA